MQFIGMSSVNRHKDWTVDLNTNEARHESGLIVRFTQDADGYNGTSPNLHTCAHPWFPENPVEQAMIIARLMREAADAYKRALDEQDETGRPIEKKKPSL